MHRDSAQRLVLDEPIAGRAAARTLSLDETGSFSWPRQLGESATVASLGKRSMDVTLALLLLLLTLPVLLLAMLAVRLTSAGPAIFVQQRIGYQGQKFRMFKLRTMRHGADKMENELAHCLDGRTFLKLENDPRVTRTGRFLRKYSIDELPQLWNVLRGDMSLVGPRPLLLCDFRKFPRREQIRRFAVKPGITGLWQVSGRSLVGDEERMRLDLEYVDRWSLGLDFAILVRTLPVVLTARGAN
jgi:lipopolysaccharide/colanic/teichoic acid biosynthesis glycosyltransferase